MSNKTITAIMVGIFNIVMFICGTVLFAFNNFNGLIYEPYITYIALAMWIVPIIYFAVSLIKNKNK
ncbi:MAG: hypothetical protein IKA09_13490 [Lachnospiraceae bacterium]|nr:hypothetical protein [Lachnospiraceae bacterium]